MELERGAPPPSWLADEFERQQEELPDLVFERLWLNRWSSGIGDAIQERDIVACTVREGPLSGREEGWMYYGGVDLSVSRDTSAIVIVGKKQAHIRLAHVAAWKPPKGGKIDLSILRQAILTLNEIYNPHFMVDPYQAELLVEDLQQRGVAAETVTFTGKNLMEMAAALVEAFSSRQIEIWNDVLLLSDLRRLKLVETPGGYRLEASRTAQGHADRATALALACLGARRAGASYFGLTEEKPGKNINDYAPDGVYLKKEDWAEEELDPFLAIHGGGRTIDDAENENRWSPPGGA
jgi:hypothetical protein